MRQALRLAKSGLGQVWPNPSVGAVVVKDGRVLGAARTANGGRPHAETQALAQAGNAARGATLYVSLEPCAHQGQTPPCTNAIIAAAIARVVIACTDTDERVSGEGIAQLQRAGISVETGCLQEEAMALNAGFFSRIGRARPWVTMKLASSMDGYIATRSGQSQWITGEAARRHGHSLRASHDVIATGIGTVLADDPSLTCRLPGCGDHSPVRLVLDRQGRLPAQATMLQDGGAPVWRWDGFGLSGEGIAPDMMLHAATGGAADSELHRLLAQLADCGVTRLLVEGGARVSGAFLHAGLVDALYWYQAPLVIGQGGQAAIGAELSAQLIDLQRATIVDSRRLGNDQLTVLRFSAPHAFWHIAQ